MKYVRILWSLSLHGFLVAFLVAVVQAFPKRIPIGALFDNESSLYTRTAFRYEIEKHNNGTQSGFKLDKYEKVIDIADGYSLGRAICTTMAKGIFALFGVTNSTSLCTVKSHCNTFHMPYVTPSAPVNDSAEHGFLLRMRPSYDLALIDIIKHYRWPRIYYIYDTQEGTEYTALVAAAERRQWEVRAAGTQSNHRTTLATYIQYCNKYRVRLSAPKSAQICIFIEHMAITVKSPGTIANYISAVRQHFQTAGYDTTPLHHRRVVLALDAVAQSKHYTVNQRPPLPMTDLRKVFRYMATPPHGVLVRLLMSILFFAGLRQADLLPKSMVAFTPLRDVVRDDIQASRGVLRVRMRHSKNLKEAGKERRFVLRPSGDPLHCPVALYEQYTARWHGQPYTTRQLAQEWSEALERLDMDSNYTLHSVCRTSATQAFAAGCPQLLVQRYGRWTSAAHEEYIDTNTSTVVNTALISAINQM